MESSRWQTHRKKIENKFLRSFRRPDPLEQNSSASSFMCDDIDSVGSWIRTLSPNPIHCPFQKIEIQIFLNNADSPKPTIEQPLQQKTRKSLSFRRKNIYLFLKILQCLLFAVRIDWIWAYIASLDSSNVLMCVACVSIRTGGRPFSFAMSMVALRTQQHAHQSINHRSERYYDWRLVQFIWLKSIFRSFSVRWIKSIASVSIESNREKPICCAIDFGVCAYETFVSLLLIWPTFAYFIANDWLNKYEKSKTRWANIRNEPRINQIKSAHIRNSQAAWIASNIHARNGTKEWKSIETMRPYATACTPARCLSLRLLFRRDFDRLLLVGRCPESASTVHSRGMISYFLHIFHQCNCEWAIPGLILCTRARCLLILFTLNTHKWP